MKWAEGMGIVKIENDLIQMEYWAIRKCDIYEYGIFWQKKLWRWVVKKLTWYYNFLLDILLRLKKMICFKHKKN